MRGAHQPVRRRAQRLRALHEWHVRRSESGEMQVAAAVSQTGQKRSFANVRKVSVVPRKWDVRRVCALARQEREETYFPLGDNRQ